MSDGFIDLRQNNTQLVEESFWPSFTDIMTVVVMIFLITSSILIVKNWELVSELQQRIVTEQQISQRLKNSIAVQQQTSRALEDSVHKRLEISQKLQDSIAAEQRTAVTIKQTSAEKATLEETLTQTQTELSLLRLQLMQAKESAVERDNLIAEQDRQIISMSVEQNKLKQNIQKNIDNLARIEQQLEQVNSLKVNLQDKLEESSIQLARKEQDFNKQLIVLADKDQQIEKVQNELESSSMLLLRKDRDLSEQVVTLANREEQLSDLQKQNQFYLDNMSEYEAQVILAQQQHSTLNNEYKELELKYNKLIKPSRSAVGKYVVEVRYEKLSGKPYIRFREDEKDSYEHVSSVLMHQKLQSLKDQYQNKLYVKIIIPDNSGLSYSEAWTFMSNILDKYDYYSQNNSVDEAIE